MDITQIEAAVPFVLAEILSSAEVPAFCREHGYRIPPSTIQYLRTAKKTPPIHMAGGRAVFLKYEFLAWFQTEEGQRYSVKRILDNMAGYLPAGMPQQATGGAPAPASAQGGAGVATTGQTATAGATAATGVAA